jgi:hypothetical protein
VRENRAGVHTGVHRVDREADTFVVALEQRIEREAADAGPGEDGLGEHRAAEQGAELDPDDREHRDERVAQRVAVDDVVVRHAFSHGGAHIVLLQDLQHAGAGHSRNQRDGEQPEGHARKDDGGGPAGAGTGDQAGS